jgi:hypothetical protein
MKIPCTLKVNGQFDLSSNQISPSEWTRNTIMQFERITPRLMATAII